MDSGDNVCNLANYIFTHFNRLQDYANVLATSKSNPIKSALINYFKATKTFEFHFDIFGSAEFFNYAKYLHSIEYLTINQYQRQLTKTDNKNSECTDDLVHFLNTFHAKFP
eukprot:274235_1